MRWIRLAPMTAESVIICVAIYASCTFQALSNHEQFGDVQRVWGAIRPLVLSEIHDGVRRVKEMELRGPFDAWKGDFWRIPVTAFHHSGLLHLVLTLGAAWYLGCRLEQRWGSLAMGLFLVPAVCLPVMAELFLGQAIIGFSGAVCAMLGVLVVLRHFDGKLAHEFSEGAAQIGVATIMIGWFATLAQVVSFPNAAHLTGFVYGALIAAITGGPLRHVRLLRVSLVLVHLWVIPALFLASHPFWIGRYHWYQAVSTQNPQRAVKSLARATSLDPSLVGAWMRWSQLVEQRVRLLDAWKLIVSGLAVNPTSEPLIECARRLWRHLDERGREDAAEVVVRFFGKQSPVWLDQIRTASSEIAMDSHEKPGKSEEAVDVREFALDRKIELPALDFSPIRSNPQKPKDRIQQNDAAEGETL